MTLATLRHALIQDLLSSHQLENQVKALSRIQSGSVCRTAASPKLTARRSSVCSKLWRKRLPDPTNNKSEPLRHPSQRAASPIFKRPASPVKPAIAVPVNSRVPPTPLTTHEWESSTNELSDESLQQKGPRNLLQQSRLLTPLPSVTLFWTFKISSQVPRRSDKRSERVTMGEGIKSNS